MWTEDDYYWDDDDPSTQWWNEPTNETVTLPPFYVTEDRMNDDPFNENAFYTNDDTQTGGFWDDVGGWFASGFKSILGGAIGTGTAVANNAIGNWGSSAGGSSSNSSNNTTRNTTTTNFLGLNATQVVLIVAAVAAGIYFARRK